MAEVVQNISRRIRRLLPSACLLVLSFTQMANAEGISFKCGPASGTYFHISFDLESHHAVMETLSGEPLKGRADATEDVVQFHIEKAGYPDLRYVLNSRAGELRSFAVPGRPSFAETVFPCVRTELRPILSRYEYL
ncbi:hypothetical protein ACQR1V_29630 [Bradyrhizobium oligotrophicum]|uniref:hypothetical protein n=1 Tax=Bradyrhizobium oligotrophicum TaxID=44255 RepID=UPI003EB922A5